jgi:uncharacterized protein
VAFRTDRSGELRPPRRLPDGRLRVDALLTRTGVFTYRNADGSTRREYRPPEEVFDAESLASFEAVPVTDEHPPMMLNAQNSRQYTRGATGENIRRDEDGRHMAGSLVVFDADLIAKMDRGKVQVSNGYICDLDMTPGTSPDGEKYDVVQRKIRGNHVAIVDSGRAGSARVRMDADDFADEVPASSGTGLACGAPAGHADHYTERTTMNLEEALKALGESNAKLEAETKRADAEKARADKSEGERDAEKARADASEKARTDAAADAEKRVSDAREQGRKDAAERLDVESKAKAAGVEFTAETTTEAIKIALVKKVDNFDCAGKPSAYIDARFDSAVERFKGGADALGAARVAANGGDPKPPQRADSEVDATRKMQDHYANAWMKGN